MVRRRALKTCAWGVFQLWAAGGACAVQQQPAAPPAPAAAPDRFAIEAYDVAGVTLLVPSEVEALVYPFVGPGRSKDDVEAARKAIQDAYAAKGYEAVTVEIPVQPQQTFSRGIVQIAVNEVTVGEVRVTGARYHSTAVARAQVPSLQEGQPVDFKALQADISAAGRFPDRAISPEFHAGKTPGTLDVDLKVDDERPLHASLQLDNDHSPSTKPLRVTASARYTNLWQAGHTVSFTYVVAPERRSDTEVFAGSYTAPLIGTPWTIALSGYKSNSNIAALGGSSVLGDGYQVGMRAIYRLPSGRTVQTISFGPDVKDFKQNVAVNGSQVDAAPIRYIPFETSYALAGAGERTSYAVSAGVTAGLRVIKRLVCNAASQTDCVPIDQFRNREAFANENFVRGNLSIDYSLATKGDFVGALRLSGQLADSHLVSNEQLSAGGLSSVRGYYQSEAVGDSGILGGLELRSPSFASLFGKAVGELRIYGFIDAAHVHLHSALAEQIANYDLVGVGGGARGRLFDLLAGEIMVGVPLTDGAVSKAGDPRVTFVARGEF